MCIRDRGITEDKLFPTIWVGTNAPIDITANPQIADGLHDGYKTIIIGYNDTNTLTLDDGNGLDLEGQWVGGANDVIGLMYLADNDIWVEMFRSNPDWDNLLITGTATIDGTLNFAADAQADDDYEVDIPNITALTTGLMVTFTANTANTDGATLEITSVGDLDAILKMHDQALVTGDIEVGQVVVCVFDGTNWQMTSQLAQ